MALSLDARHARIFRITHVDNVRWILKHGLHCKNSTVRDPDFRRIGNEELIAKRTTRTVQCSSGGTLSDYVPFYFTPRSPMLLNIKTGYNGVTKVPNSEIAILVSSLYKLREAGHPFVFTDRHAYLRTASFYEGLEDIDKVDWTLLQSGDFRRNPDDPDKFARYEAEALIHRHLPVSLLGGIVLHGENERRTIEAVGRELGVNVETAVRPSWYF